MRTLLDWCFLLMFICEILPNITADDSDVELEWRKFKSQYYNDRDRAPEEERYRKSIFVDNYDIISKHNDRYKRGLVSYELGVNHFADERHSNLVRDMNDFARTARFEETFNASTYDSNGERAILPWHVDWRTADAVARVKDQAKCNGCWAFSAVGVLEGQLSLKHGKKVSLSEQQLLDCAVNRPNLGCVGGTMNAAFEYVKTYGGSLNAEYCYPYHGVQGQCVANPYCNNVYISEYMNVRRGDESALQYAVATVGPVAIALDAAHFSFRFYRNGVYYDPKCSSFKQKHTALIVGYGTENGMDYWLIKNSWGTTWGENGYIKIARNMNNHCGIATAASFAYIY